MKTKVEFDERQQQIRGEVFSHGFFLAVALLTLNAILNRSGVEWASAYHQNYLTLLLLICSTAIEAVLRGAYFNRSESRWPMIISLMLIVLTLCVFHISDLIHGEPLITGGMITDACVSLVHGIFFTALIIAMIVKEIRERREKSE